jgi:predicted nucleic acid-binding Zn ribbon protein
MQHARATLRKIFTDTLRREGTNAPMIAWPLACGASTAERTNAVQFADGVLTVAVPDKTWQIQLQGLSRQYLSALNQVSSEPVSAIQFVVADRAQR